MLFLQELGVFWTGVVLLSSFLLLAASAFGIYRFFINKSALYFRILTLATACYAVVSVFRLLYNICFFEDFSGMGITFFGYFGCYMFLFSANFGQYDSLIDDKTVVFKKYRIIALIAPILLFTLLVFYTAHDIAKTSAMQNIITFAGYAPAVLASYYNLKHLIIPDMGFTFVRWIRLTNLCALLIEFADIIRLYAASLYGGTSSALLGAVIAVLFMLMYIFAQKGRKSWLV